MLEQSSFQWGAERIKLVKSFHSQAKSIGEVWQPSCVGVFALISSRHHWFVWNGLDKMIILTAVTREMPPFILQHSGCPCTRWHLAIPELRTISWTHRGNVQNNTLTEEMSFKYLHTFTGSLLFLLNCCPSWSSWRKEKQHKWFEGMWQCLCGHRSQSFMTGCV